MKKLIFTPVCALLLAAPASAQKIELGGNLGLNYGNTALATVSAMPVVSLKAMYNVSKSFQVGLLGDISWVSYENSFGLLYFEDLYSSSSILPARDYYATYTQAVHSIRLVASTKHKMGNTEIYAGMSGGYMIGLTENVTWNGSYGLKNGFVTGVQAGVTFYVTPNLGLNAELGADYINMGGMGDYNRDISKTRFTTVTFPATVGIRYKLFCSCDHHCPLSKEPEAPESDID